MCFIPLVFLCPLHPFPEMVIVFLKDAVDNISSNLPAASKPSLSNCHSPSQLLILNSTFNQLLVAPTSCHVDADRRGTFCLTPCKCGSLKQGVG